LHGKDGVEVTGEVPDVLPHLEEAALLAVALESGGGTRLKILEALAAGLPVVSTPVGAEGLDLVAGEHLVIAERAVLADAITRVLADRSAGATMARNGRALVRRLYDWSAIGAEAAEALSAAVRGSARRG
jgi:glycosyltransferase involved in cell wall biosynthesis